MGKRKALSEGAVIRSPPQGADAPERCVVYACSVRSDFTELQTQLAHGRIVANARGGTYSGCFTDVGAATGYGWKSRPGLRRLIEAAGRGEFDAVVIERFDRITADAPPGFDVTRRLSDRGVHLIVTNSASTAARSRTLMAQRGTHH